MTLSRRRLPAEWAARRLSEVARGASMLERGARRATFRERARRLVLDMLRRARRLRLQQTAASLAFLSLFAAVPVAD